jgi:D-glycero-D-manno-heptose 1,7-bisphosphate phosphatase
MAAGRTNKAVFLDRDGVVNELIYFAEHGRIDTPLNPRQFRLISGVAAGIKTLQQYGFRVVIVSNQPGIAKGQLTPTMFERLVKRMRRLLKKEGVEMDAEYYCLHHPSAIKVEYQKTCSCRKPNPGLIVQAVREGGLDIKASFMVGDGLTDIEAGRRAGCRTVLIGHLSSLLVRVMKRKKVYPDYLAETFQEAVDWIVKQGDQEVRSKYA